MKTKLALRLKTLLQEKNLTESELARQTGVCQPVIHRMASGETDNPKIETLKPIAKFFSISLEQLIGDAPLSNDDPTFYFEQSSTTLPLIPLTEAASWVINGHQSHLNTQVQTDLKMSVSAFALRLEDSTMYPMFPDGTLLIIEPTQAPSHRDFVVAQINDQPAIFKQLLIDGKDHYLKSVNSDYPTLKMQKRDKILGVMLQARIDFRQN